MVGLFLMATGGAADWDSTQWIAIIGAIGTQILLIIGAVMKYQEAKSALDRIEKKTDAAAIRGESIKATGEATNTAVVVAAPHAPEAAKHE